MIRHTILFKVKQSVSKNEIDSALQSFQLLENKLSGISSIVSGECFFHDEKSTRFFMDGVSHAVSIDFKDKAALQQFFEDPVTHPAKNAVVNVAEGGYEAIVGFDLEGG